MSLTIILADKGDIMLVDNTTVPPTFISRVSSWQEIMKVLGERFGATIEIEQYPTDYLCKMFIHPKSS